MVLRLECMLDLYIYYHLIAPVNISFFIADNQRVFTLKNGKYLDF